MYEKVAYFDLHHVSWSVIGSWARRNDEQLKVFIRNERSFGITINSDGLGIGYREGKEEITAIKEYWNLTLEHLSIPKSSKLVIHTHRDICFGKKNSVIYMRAGLGHQYEMFPKEDAGGIAIRYFISGGPVIGLYKPIYYRFIYNVGGTINEPQLRKRFDIRIHDPTMIYSKAGLTRDLRKQEQCRVFMQKEDSTLNTAA